MIFSDNMLQNYFQNEPLQYIMQYTGYVRSY
ncbi:Uncharacterised protein [Escherichia coli]|nr:hypothetical protein G920_02031 [Escherichia coli UMEA 3152-1]CAD5641759.1 Uncharacterised protein [Escherichia coli]GEE61956.1 hypothetical protein EC142370_01987 [Escherichia coli O145:H34]CAD5664821.1 Uncharacterised protein [Escherichia coli]CAD5670450.1 Uncharacterised protein [Escherichia coli]